MVDREMLRAHLADIEAALAQLEPLQRIREEYRALLGEPKSRATTARSRPATQAAGRSPKREGSIRSTVLDILRESGEPLRVEELIVRARARGVETTAKRPASVIDLVAHGLAKDGHPVRRVRPRTWQWVGPVDSETA